jgi:hypothetical protein
MEEKEEKEEEEDRSVIELLNLHSTSDDIHMQFLEQSTVYHILETYNAVEVD